MSDQLHLDGLEAVALIWAARLLLEGLERRPGRTGDASATLVPSLISATAKLQALPVMEGLEWANLPTLEEMERR